MTRKSRPISTDIDLAAGEYPTLPAWMIADLSRARTEEIALYAPRPDAYPMREPHRGADEVGEDETVWVFTF